MSINPDDPHRYDDIIGLPHFTSRVHPRMPRENRAAQFAPFAALVGYDAAVKETARLTDDRLELDEYEKLYINDRLQALMRHAKQRPEAEITRFKPDAKKRGGEYAVVAGCVKKVDEYEREVVFESGERVSFDDIIAVEAELFKSAEGDCAILEEARREL